MIDSKLFKITVRSFLTLIVALILCSPYIFYEIGLSNIEGRPSYAINRAISNDEAQKTWNDLGKTGVIEIPKLNPWGYVLSLFQESTSKNLLTITYIPWTIARNYNRQHLKNRQTIYWHLSGTALIIWLTRNWSTQDTLAKVREIQNNEATRKPCEKSIPTVEEKHLCFLSHK